MPVPVEMLDWALVPNYLVPAADTRVTNVAVPGPDPRVMLGQLQPLPHGVYSMAARCNQHTRCSRTRSWSINGDQAPGHVDAVLVRWLEAGRRVADVATAKGVSDTEFRMKHVPRG